MHSDRRSLYLFAVVTLSLLPGCSGNDAAAPEPTISERPAQVGGDGGARTLDIPGSALPSNHPPIAETPRPNEIVWTVPDGWTSVPPLSTMRWAQYVVPGKTGDAECVVYYFGPGQGGDAMSNARRWAGQFVQPDGGSSAERMKVDTLSSENGEITVVEVTGTYDGGMTMTDAPAKPQANSMLLGGIVQGPDAPWFFKFTGPEQTIRAQREAFIGLLRSVRQAG